MTKTLLDHFNGSLSEFKKLKGQKFHISESTRYIELGEVRLSQEGEFVVNYWSCLKSALGRPNRVEEGTLSLKDFSKYEEYRSFEEINDFSP